MLAHDRWLASEPCPEPLSLYLSTSSIFTTRTGPKFASRIGFSIFDRSPTTTTANLSAEQVLLRRALDVGGRHRLNLRHVVAEERLRQAVDHQLRDVARHARRRLEPCREAERLEIPRLASSSSAGTGLRMPSSSLKNSCSDSTVLSVCTPAVAKNGPADRACRTPRRRRTRSRALRAGSCSAAR